MFFWAWVFIIATTLTAIFKSESQDYGDDEVVSTYKTLWKIIKLPAVLKYCAMLLTAKVFYCITQCAMLYTAKILYYIKYCAMLYTAKVLYNAVCYTIHC